MPNNQFQIIIHYCRENYLSIPMVINYLKPLLPKIDNLESYLNKIDKSKFVTTKCIGKVQVQLLDMLKAYEFNGEVKDRLMIEEIEVHSLLEFPIECNEMISTNQAIAKYCKDHNEMTYDKFKEYLLKSKVMKKCSPPLPLIEKRCEETAELVKGFIDDEY